MRRIETPEGGWKEDSWYIIDVAYRPTNPIHRAMLFTGFLDDHGEPGSYSGIHSGSYESVIPFGEVYYLVPVKLVATREDMASVYRLPPR